MLNVANMKNKIINKLINILLITSIIIISYYVLSFAYRVINSRADLNQAHEKYDQPDADNNQSIESLENEVIGYLEIPAVDLESAVLLGNPGDGLASALNEGVTFDPSGSMPNEAGVVVLAGHREMAFKKLEDIQVGDQITLNITGQIYHYQVTDTKVIEDDQVDEVFWETDGQGISLYTCYPFGFGTKITNRYVVKAEIIES